MKRRKTKLYLIIFCCLSAFLILVFIIKNNIYQERLQQYSYTLLENNNARYINTNSLVCSHTKKLVSNIKGASFEQSLNKNAFTLRLKSNSWMDEPKLIDLESSKPLRTQSKVHSSNVSLLSLSKSNQHFQRYNAFVFGNEVYSMESQSSNIALNTTHFSFLNTTSNKIISSMDFVQMKPKMFTLPGEESGDGPGSPDLPSPLGNHLFSLLTLSFFYLLYKSFR